MKQPRLWTAAIIAVALLATAGVGADALLGQEEAEGHRGFMAAKGRVTYRVYCASCHGPEGTGNGNLAQFLTVPPIDLTRLAIDSGGEFPTELVLQSIDGRKEIRGHGGKEMPVWGDVFQDSLSERTPQSGETGEERAQRKVTELTLYLQTIQRAAEGEPDEE